MKNTIVVMKRELNGYFATPVAYVFLAIYLILSGVFTWYMGSYYERDQADLQSFFQFHPWLYLALIPAISMRIWAEERHQGTDELLLTTPASDLDVVLGKYLAGVAIFTVAGGGLMFEGSVGGQRFSYEAKE